MVLVIGAEVVVKRIGLDHKAGEVLSTYFHDTADLCDGHITTQVLPSSFRLFVLAHHDSCAGILLYDA